jgi:predicted alpha/beta-hydrolase family hydrolase
MRTFDVDLGEAGTVAARIYEAAAPRAGVTLVLAHGAGAPQTSPFMVAFAEALAARGLETATFNFPYMEARRRVPDRGPVLEACYATVVGRLAAHPGLAPNRIVIGGKSMGGRIASQMAARDAAASRLVAGLVFLGYPLHPPGKPDRLRTRHLPSIAQPMLCVQGARDPFGTPDELRAVFDGLPADTELVVIDGGDHSFKVPKKLGIAQADVYRRVQDAIVGWIDRLGR